MQYLKLWNLDTEDIDSPVEQGVLCPVCGFDYVHFNEPAFIASDDYTAWRGGRGDAIMIPMFCEDGHQWVLGFGFHKGNTFMFWERGEDRR